jgi:nitrate/nitrite-specific signal transduction histidine kinase
MTAMRRRATKLGAQLRAGATECGGARIDVIAPSRRRRGK